MAEEDKVWLITGCSSGMGREFAFEALRAGYRVVATARDPKTLQVFVEEFPERARALALDVTDKRQVAEVVDKTIAEFGRIDVLVNNAAYGYLAAIEEGDEEDVRAMFETNFWGVVYGSLAALSHLRANGGALINVGSEVSEAVVPLQGMYAASKHAVKGFTDALRVELLADGAPVSVTLIQPTAVDTPFPEHAGNYLSQEPKLPTPMIAPEAVADAILAAASKPTRERKVGMMARVNTTMAKLMPAIGDRMAGMQIGRQQRDEPPHSRPGSLYEAGDRADYLIATKVPVNHVMLRVDDHEGRRRGIPALHAFTVRPGADNGIAGLRRGELRQVERDLTRPFTDLREVAKVPERRIDGGQERPLPHVELVGIGADILFESWTCLPINEAVNLSGERSGVDSTE